MKNENDTYIVEGFGDALHLRNKMKSGDTVYVELNKTTYVKIDPDILQAVKTKQPGYEHLYGPTTEN